MSLASCHGPHAPVEDWEGHFDALERALAEIRADHLAGRACERTLPEPSDALGPLPLHLEGRARRLLSELEALEEMRLADAERLAASTTARSRRPTLVSTSSPRFVDRRA